MSCLEISTGQSSFLPRRLWIHCPEMPLTLRPIPPGLPWAVDLNLALISSDQGHPSSLAFPVCCPVSKEQLCSSLIPLQKLQQLPMTMTTMTVTIQRTKSKLRSLVFMWPQHLSPTCTSPALVPHGPAQLQPHGSTRVSARSRASLLCPGLSPTLPVEIQTIPSGQVGKWKKQAMKPCTQPHFC